MGGGWLVGAKVKDQHGLMKDRVRENYEFEVRFRLKKLMKKIKKNVPQMTHLRHICTSNVRNLYLKVRHFIT